ncbi:MAG: galactose ABC transporter substrate-binding protein [Oscillospiraceae bacterium]|nr:galactose ABC transporter substrate-binding protein [Oscillospiraceae bacterium]
MKKMIALLLALVMVLALAACGGDDQTTGQPSDGGAAEPAPAPADENKTDDAPAPAEDKTEDAPEDAPAPAPSSEGLEIGVNIQEFSNAYLTDMRNGLQATADSMGITLDIADGQSSEVTISGNIDLFLTKGYEILAVNMMNTTSAPDILSKTEPAGVPVVFFNVEPEADVLAGSPTSYYVGAQAADSGTMQGEALVQYWNSNPDADRNGDGVMQYVMIQGDPGHQDSILRTEYSVKAITDAGIEVEMVATDVANWARADGQDVMARILAAHDDIEAIICNNDEMALGAIEALKAGGYLTNGGTFIPVVGVDCNEEAKIAIQDGTMYASVFNDAKGQADAVVKLCALIAKGETPTSENLGYELDGQYVWVPYIPVTIDNLNEIG